MDRVAFLGWRRGRGTGEIVQVERPLPQAHYGLAPGQTRTTSIDLLCLDGDGGRSWR
jgi:hypothetical protein